MCGHVGFACSGFAQHNMKELFKKMLAVGVIRGHHATGVAAYDTLEGVSGLVKKAKPASTFLSLEDEMEKVFHFRHNFNIYIGHNRFATAGDKANDAFAHPFEQGHIIGAHNGTVHDRSLLDDPRKYEVDSEQVFAHMATNGLDDTISKLDAAFALVWVNREEKTLNFIRNKERPLAFARLDNGAFVWASEREMLEWIVNRERGISFAKAKGEVALWDLPEYTHLAIPFTGRTMGTPKLKVLPKPTFPEYNWNSRWGIGTGTDADYEDWWNGRTSSTRTVHEAPARETQRYETMYQRRARECVEKICSSGNVGSWIEVEFLGHQHERSYSGFESSISLFKYRSWVKPNLEFIFHSFNHAGCLTKDWTDADIGKRLYGRVAGANPINEASYKCIRNEALGYTLGVESLTETRPPKIYSYYEEGAAIEEGKNIVPFQSKGQRRKQAKRGKKEQGRFKSALTDAYIPDGGPDDPIFSYADGQRVSYNQFHRDRADNQGRCACCAHQLPTAGISGVHLIQWYNEEDNTTERMLACSPECAREVIDLCAEMDAEYEDHKRSGESL